MIPKASYRFAASALSGVLLFACFPKTDWNLLVWIACAPLLAAVVTETRLRQAFLMAYMSGAIFLGGSCYWFVGVMERYGGLNLPLSIGVLVLFLLVFSCFYAFFFLLICLVARKSPSLALFLSPFLWVSMEVARTYLITGFPWNLLGYAVGATGLRQVASVTSVYGLSFLAVTTSALLVWTFLEPRSRWVKAGLALSLLLLVTVNWLLTPPRMPPASNLAVLVQPDIPLGDAAVERWAPWRHPAPLEALVALSVETLDHKGTSGAPPLLIWSENSAPFYFPRDSVFRAAMEKMAREAHAYVLVGAVTFVGQGNGQPQNSAVMVDPEGRFVFQYDKIHLVPFGEYVPWWAFPGKVGKITTEVGNFVPGTDYKVAETPQGKIGIFICYEAIFPQLVRRLVWGGAGVLVNISNDAWYGDSSAAFQHLAMARLRAIENRRYLLRATNDGITAVIDPYGRVVEQLPRHRAMALAGRYNFLTRRTFYTAHGDVFAWLCVAVTVGTLAYVARRDRKR